MSGVNPVVAVTGICPNLYNQDNKKVQLVARVAGSGPKIDKVSEFCNHNKNKRSQQHTQINVQQIFIFYTDS